MKPSQEQLDNREKYRQLLLTTDLPQGRCALFPRGKNGEHQRCAIGLAYEMFGKIEGIESDNPVADREWAINTLEWLDLLDLFGGCPLVDTPRGQSSVAFTNDSHHSKWSFKEIGNHLVWRDLEEDEEL